MTDTANTKVNLEKELKELQQSLKEVETSLESAGEDKRKKKILESQKKITAESIEEIKSEMAKIGSNDTLETIEEKIDAMIESLHKEGDKDFTDLFEIKIQLAKLTGTATNLIGIEKTNAQEIVKNNKEKAEKYLNSGNDDSAQNISPMMSGSTPPPMVRGGRGGPTPPPVRGGRGGPPTPLSRGANVNRDAVSRKSIKETLESLKEQMINTKNQNVEILEKIKAAEETLDSKIEKQQFDEAKETEKKINELTSEIVANTQKFQAAITATNQLGLRLPEIADLGQAEFTEHLEAKFAKPLQSVVNDMESSLALKDWDSLYKHKAKLDLLCKTLPEQFLSDLSKKPKKGSKQDLSQLDKLISISGTYSTTQKNDFKSIEDLLVVARKEGDGLPKEKKDAKDKLLALTESELRAYFEKVNQILTPSPFSEDEITAYLLSAKTIRDYIPTIPEDKKLKEQHAAQKRDWGANFSSKVSISEAVFVTKLQKFLDDYQEAVNSFDKAKVDKIKAEIKKTCEIDTSDTKKKLLKDWMPPAKIIMNPDLITEMKLLKETIDNYQGAETRKKIYSKQLETKQATFDRTEKPQQEIQNIKAKLSLYFDISTGKISIPTILNNEILLDSIKDALILEGARIEDKNPAYKQNTTGKKAKKNEDEDAVQKVALPEASKFITEFEKVTILIPEMVEPPSDLIKKHDDIPAYTGPKDFFDLQNPKSPENSYQENLKFAFIQKSTDDFILFENNELISHISMLATNKKGAYSNLFLMAIASGYVYVDIDKMKDGKIDTTRPHLTLEKDSKKADVRFIEVNPQKFDDFIKLTLEASKQINGDDPFLGQGDEDTYKANLKSAFEFMLKNPEVQLFNLEERKKDIILYHPDLIAHNNLVTDKIKEENEAKKQKNENTLNEIRSEQQDITNQLGGEQQEEKIDRSTILTTLFDSKTKRDSNDSVSSEKSDPSLVYKNASTASLPKLDVKLLIVDLNKTTPEKALQKLEEEAAKLIRLEKSLEAEKKALETIRDENPTNFAREGGIQKLENVASRQQQVVNAKASIDSQLIAVQLTVASSASGGLSEEKRKTLMLNASTKMLENEQEKQKLQQERQELDTINILATETANKIATGKSAVDAIREMANKQSEQSLDFDKLKIALSSQVSALSKQNAQTRAVAKILNDPQSHGIVIKNTRPTL